MAVKIARRIEPTSEQLAASVILTGASALRMMRAEAPKNGLLRRQTGSNELEAVS